MKCPKCGCTNCNMTVTNNTKVHTKSSGYGFFRGCCGWFLMGPVGLLCGLCGAGKSHSWTESTRKEFWVCQECGTRFTASDAEKSSVVPARFYCDNVNDFIEYQESPLIKNFIKKYSEKWSSSVLADNLLIRKNTNEKFEKHKNSCDASWFENTPIIFALEDRSGVILTGKSIIIDTVSLAIGSLKHIAIQDKTIYVETFCIRFSNIQKAELFYEILKELFDNEIMEFSRFEEYAELLKYLQSLPDSKLINQPAHFSSQEEYAEFVQNLKEQGMKKFEESRPTHFKNYIQARKDQEKLTTPPTILFILQLIIIFLIHLIFKGFMNAILFTVLWGILLFAIYAIYITMVDSGFKKKVKDYLPSELKVLIEENESSDIAKTGTIRMEDMEKYIRLDSLSDLEDIPEKASIKKKQIVLYITLFFIFATITCYELIKFTDSSNSYLIEKVSNGYLGFYNDVTIGEVFKEILGSGSWDEMLTDSDNYSVIQFDNSVDDTIIQFKIENGMQEFDVIYMKYCGEIMEQASDAKMKLDDIYGAYYIGHPELGGQENMSWDNVTTKGHFIPRIGPETNVAPTTVAEFESAEIPNQEFHDEFTKTQEAVSMDDFILPDSDSKYLTYDDLSELDAAKLRLARNEIYARHGRLYQTEDLNAYFSSQPWYNGYLSEDEFDDGVLNGYEKANLDLIKSIENKNQNLNEILISDIFLEDNLVCWGNSSAIYIIPVKESDYQGLYVSMGPNINSGNTALYGLVTSTTATDKGGITCTAEMYDYDTDKLDGILEVTWDSVETIDYPSVSYTGGRDYLFYYNDFQYSGYLIEDSQ